MRVALLSDIHGNLQALDLVLADLGQIGADQVICLGDIASLGPQPREVISRLRERHIPCVRGNHDDYLLEPALIRTQPRRLREAEEWCLSQLMPEDFDFLRASAPTVLVSLDAATDLLCFHGSPRSNETWLFPTTPPADLDEMFARADARLLAGGHTHVQMLRQHRGRLIINPGSVGMPFEFPMPGPGPEPRLLRQAEYALIEISAGRLTLTLRQLPIDFEALTRTTRASGYPEPEAWLATWAA